MNRRHLLHTIVVAFAILGAASCPQSLSPETTAVDGRPSTLDKIRKSKKVIAGWAPYAPYASKGVESGKVEGFYVELFERAMQEGGIEVEWVETTWGTMIADLHAGRFQVMAAPVFRTVQRALEVSFSRPIDFFGYSAIVKAND